VVYHEIGGWKIFRFKNAQGHYFRAAVTGGRKGGGESRHCLAPHCEVEYRIPADIAVTQEYAVKKINDSRNYTWRFLRRKRNAMKLKIKKKRGPRMGLCGKNDSRERQ